MAGNNRPRVPIKMDPIYKCKRCGAIVNSALDEQKYYEFHVCHYKENGDAWKIGFLEKIGYDYNEVKV
jgi:hypothetical protein